MKKLLVFLVPFVSNMAFGQLNFDRTRIILDASQGNSQSIMVSNSNSTEPYLAQAWIENEQGEKITAPLVALPILQRVEGNQEKQIRVSLIGNQTTLRQDQESLFSFKVLGMPPKSGSGKNEMVIVVTSDLKLFYRPIGIQKYNQPNGWLYDAVVTKSAKGIIYNNPTPYHIVFMGSENIGSKYKGKDKVIKPFSTESLDITVGNRFTLYFMGDQGDGVKVQYSCANGSCTLI